MYLVNKKRYMEDELKEKPATQGAESCGWPFFLRGLLRRHLRGLTRRRGGSQHKRYRFPGKQISKGHNVRKSQRKKGYHTKPMVGGEKPPKTRGK